MPLNLDRKDSAEREAERERERERWGAKKKVWGGKLLRSPRCERVIYPRILQGSAKRWALGCVNPTSWLPLAASSRNLGPTL